MEGEEEIDLSDVELHITKLQLQLDCATDQIKKNDAELLNLSIKNNELECGLKDKTHLLKSFQEKLNRREHFYNSLEKSANEYQIEIETLKDKLNTSQKTIEHLKTMLRNMSFEKSEGLRENISLETELSACKQSRKVQQVGNPSIEEMVTSARKELAVLKQEQDDFFTIHKLKSINKLEQEKFVLQSLVDTKTDENYKLKEDCTYYQGMCEHFKKVIDDLKLQNNNTFYEEKWRENIKESKEIIEMLMNKYKSLIDNSEENLDGPTQFMQEELDNEMIETEAEGSINNITSTTLQSKDDINKSQETIEKLKEPIKIDNFDDQTQE